MDSVVGRCLEHAEWLEMQGPEEVPGGLLLPKEDAKAIRMLVERLAAKDAQIAELKARVLTDDEMCHFISVGIMSRHGTCVGKEQEAMEEYGAFIAARVAKAAAQNDAMASRDAKAADVSSLHSSLSAVAEAVKKLQVALAEAAAQVRRGGIVC